MNDTHGAAGKGWYAFDLDGVLAKYDGWKGIDHIGEPVKPMVDLVKKMHAEGKVVKILTARVAPRANAEYRPNPFLGAPPEKLAPFHPFASTSEYKALYGAAKWSAEQFIDHWCAKNLGFIPEITHEKDHRMLELYDDRVKQVVPNEGVLVEDLYRRAGSMLKEVNADNGWLLARLESKRNGFWTGFLLAYLLYLLVGVGVKACGAWLGPEKEPARVRFEEAHKVLCDLVNDWPEAAK